jgi:O-antigen/teichoic acid export membrane protein
MLEKVAALRQDPILGRVVRSSAHLLSTNSLSLALSFLMGLLSARLLGVEGFGLVGLVMGYASTVNSLLSFRMGELVVRYGGEYLERDEKAKLGELVRTAALAEATVSLLAFLVVALSAGLAEVFFAKRAGTAWMFAVFALGLLANFNYETSVGVLQITGRIRLQGVVNLIQSIVGVVIIGAAFVWGGGLIMVLLAYLIGKTILGLGVFVAAQMQLRRALEPGWWRGRRGAITGFSELVRFAVSSNVSATIIKIFRESELLWVGFFLSLEAVGYYRAAYTVVGLLSVAADPLIATVYPELNRLIVQRAWPRLQDFLRKVTTLSLVYNLLQVLAFAVLGRWILWVYGRQYVDAYPALLVLLIGLAFNYTLFWNRPLLLSLGLPGYPIRVTLAAGLVKLALAFPIVPRFGYVAEAALLSFYYIASVGAMAWRGVREMRRRAAIGGTG